jgi:formylglycine-generating enzyme required for sulfatase activity
MPGMIRHHGRMTSRRRCALGVAIALTFATACRSRAGSEPSSTGALPATADAPALDAAVGPIDAVRPIDADVQAYLDRLEPRGRPPRPTIRRYRQGDCRTEYAPRPDRDPNPMCRVTGGTFMMGGRVESKSPAFGPTPVPVATTVGDFDIDQFEVTAQQAVLFLNAHGNACPGLHGQRYQNPEECVAAGFSADGLEERDGTFFTEKGRELGAVVAFSLEGAMRYCAWVGKQVPSSAQWEYAARHDPKTGRDLVFPWGDRWDQRRAECFFNCTPVAPEAEVGLVGRFDGTRGRGDGSSPWGLHDAVDASAELIFACASPDKTCRAGSQCECGALRSTAGQSDPIALATFARLDGGGDYFGLRCARPR